MPGEGRALEWNQKMSIDVGLKNDKVPTSVKEYDALLPNLVVWFADPNSMEHLPEYDFVNGICERNVHKGCAPSTDKLPTIEVPKRVLPEHLLRRSCHPDPVLRVCLSLLHWLHRAMTTRGMYLQLLIHARLSGSRTHLERRQNDIQGDYVRKPNRNTSTQSRFTKWETW